MITKSNYVEFVNCPRALYYSKYYKDKAKELDEQAKKRIDEGNLINEFATSIFDNTVRIKKDPNVVDIDLQVELTNKLLHSSALAEASFKFEDLFCAVDILKNNNDGSYDIYEVKASTDIDKHLSDYYPDTAFQKYVLERCGLKIRDCYILHLNKNYIRKGDIEVNKLLISYPISKDKEFEMYYNNIPLELDSLRHILKKQSVPEYGHCTKSCPYFEYCHSNLVKPNITDLNGFRLNKAHDLIDQGIISFKDVANAKIKLNNRQAIQLRTSLAPQSSPYVDKTFLSQFLKSIKYPVYHLDFETMNEAKPPFDGTSPYQQIPFQYSLHIEYEPGGKLVHKEFLASKLDSEYELAKQLCNDIPLDATSMAYNMTFEKSVLKHLANRFDDLHEHLMNIHNNLIDLLEPFKLAYYYDIKQGGSNSIKYVMPALCPDMEEAYHNLPVVHNGGEALTMFPIMLDMSNINEKNKVRQGMLQYCELDTLSMVKVLNRLWEVVK